MVAGSNPAKSAKVCYAYGVYGEMVSRPLVTGQVPGQYRVDTPNAPVYPLPTK
jgi:hypothetical protein